MPLRYSEVQECKATGGAGEMVVSRNKPETDLGSEQYVCLVYSDKTQEKEITSEKIMHVL